MMDRYDKIMDICGATDECEFMDKYEGLIWNIIATKRTQLKTKDEIQDLYNDGIVKLFECLDSYDPAIGKVKFSSYFTNHFKFWLNNNFKTNYTGIKTNSRAMQKQRDLYKQSNEALNDGNIQASDELYNQANSISGKFADMSNPSILDIISYEGDFCQVENEFTLKEIMNQLDEDSYELMDSIYGISSEPIPIGVIADINGVSRRTIHRRKIKVLEQLKDLATKGGVSIEL